MKLFKIKIKIKSDSNKKKRVLKLEIETKKSLNAFVSELKKKLFPYLLIISSVKLFYLVVQNQSWY
jgi:hypothetical protein